MLDRPQAHERADEWGPRRPWLLRYVFALAIALAGLLVALALLQFDGTPFYAVLVGCVAVSVWYGGLGSGLVTAACCWSAALVLFVGEPELADAGDDDERVRWGMALIVALAVVWVAALLRQGRERATTAAVAAHGTIRDVTALQDLAAACSAALTQGDVARALIERMPVLLGARGGAVALADGDDLVILDPQVGTGLTHLPGARIPRAARAPIARAAATGRTIVVRDRETFERSYPDGVALTAYARAAVAVPLRVAGEVAGAVSFLFDREDAMAEDAEAVAGIASDLASQALERARLYEREYESRRALDRILRMSPALHADSPDAVTEAICREARVVFGADLGMLWHLRGSVLELVRADPDAEPLVPGLIADLEDFPGLMDAVGRLQVSFVQDVQAEARGVGLERVTRLGLRSSLRMPVAVAGEAEHLVIVSWESAISEPDPSTIVLARRLADQAGLALEQLERRRAQAEAAVRADETHRLQEVTAALAVASSATDVSDTCLEHALESVGADAGFVVLSRAGSVALEMVSSRGYGDEELAVWRGFDLDADVPVSRAYGSGEPVWALTAEEVAAFTALQDHGDACWIALPLKTVRGVRGVLHLSFRRERRITEGERRWLQTVVSQCALALERSLIFDVEQRLRERSERLQELTAALSNALTRADVAEVVAQELPAALGADAAIVGIVLEDRHALRSLAWEGFEDAWVESRLETPLDRDTPEADAVRRHILTFYESFEELRARFPRISREEVAGHESLLLVPLVAERRVNGLLTAGWEKQRPLTIDERTFVASLAGQAAQALERAGHFEFEQTIAATLQRSVLPTTLPRVEGVQLAARYVPGTAELSVGGDWFDAIPLRDGRLGLVVGDVVGKGVHAAATMAQLRNALRAFSLDRIKPSSTLTRLNRLAEEVLETVFATVVYAVVDPRALVCRYSSAGHPPPLVALSDGRVELLERGRGLPLGTGAGAEYAQGTVELPSGSLLLLYTDGLVERRGESIDLGLEQLRAAVASGPRDPERLVEHVLEAMVGSAERDDDIALLAVRVFSVAPRPLDLRVPNEIVSLDVVRDALRAWLEGARAPRAEAEEVVLAAWEACANAIEHANAPGSGHVVVRATLDDSRVRVVVEDSGRWRPPAETPDRGLGLRLIHSLMSSVDVAVSEGGTRVTLEKALAGAGEP
jgi:serine phosphatase RsbU (regulator of sigma subunit)/anti-sigma regulatory factor (Ser/Thr protein kinase)